MLNIKRWREQVFVSQTLIKKKAEYFILYFTYIYINIAENLLFEMSLRKILKLC